jgi:raffinose/stachyose/melibiose transport system permease protein
VAVVRGEVLARPRLHIGLRRRLRRDGHVIWFLGPAVGLVVALYVAPNLLNFAYSFTNWSPYHDYNDVSWVGLDNFRELSKQGIVWNDLWVTIKYALLVMVFENVVTLALALALERTTRVNGFFRSVFFIPVLISSLAAGYLWSGIFDTNGVLNRFLSTLSPGDVHVQWLGSTTWTLVVIALIHAWRFGGVHMLVYIAALNSIPQELIESAKVEGASTWRIIRKIKLPLIGPAFTFNITLTLIGALSIFELVLATTKGGPARSTEVLNVYIFNQFGGGYFSYATAIGLMLFLLICLVAFPLIAFLRRREVQL